eukprot:3272194-Heterocapsa_arctica.AAC.1
MLKCKAAFTLEPQRREVRNEQAYRLRAWIARASGRLPGRWKPYLPNDSQSLRICLSNVCQMDLHAAKQLGLSIGHKAEMVYRRYIQERHNGFKTWLVQILKKG